MVALAEKDKSSCRRISYLIIMTGDVSFNELGLAFVILMGFNIIVLPRRFATIPVIMTCCYITLGSGFIIAGLHFSALRLIILSGWLRVIFRREFSIKLNIVDKLLILWTIFNVVSNTILWQTSEAFINRLGFIYDVIGIYFLFRFLILDIAEIELVIKGLAIILIPLTILMLNEYMTGRNLFSIFGGVNEYTAIRDGKFRCQGPFDHPILAGTFGATIMPLFVSLWFKQGIKISGIIGFVTATIITGLSVSSGPFIAYIFGILGIMMWPLRQQMRLVRYVAIFILIMLHAVMKAPAWHIMARIADLTGGHGWYRAAVIDSAIEHFSEWWMVGTKNTANWGLTVLPNNPTKSDMTNQYLNIGIDGGLITMLLFILIIIIAFRDLGRSLKATENEPFPLKFLLWSMGAALFAHAVNFLSVSYYDQSIVFWYLLLAMIATSINLFGKSKDTPLIAT